MSVIFHVVRTMHLAVENGHPPRMYNIAGTSTGGIISGIRKVLNILRQRAVHDGVRSVIPSTVASILSAKDWRVAVVPVVGPEARWNSRSWCSRIWVGGNS